MKKPLPAYISTSDPHSFAKQTIERRKPAIINLVIKENRVEDALRDVLLDFKQQINAGVISDPFDAWPQAVYWLPHREYTIWKSEIETYKGKSWTGIPWYFAEAFFYLMLLFTWGYFDPASAYYMQDPFQQSKDRELFSSDGGLDLGRQVCRLLHQKKSDREILQSLILFSLWGNRIDLSNFFISKKPINRILTAEENNLIRNDLNRLMEAIRTARRIDFILDNCGPELVCDLMLVLYLLSDDPQRTVYLHVKEHPFFVSDAMVKDVQQTVNAFIYDEAKELSKTGRRLKDFIAAKRLRIQEHFFWTGPQHFPAFPNDILEELSASNLVILKGDANYRRLLSDRKWEPWTDMGSVVSYFPTSFVALRTMKSEIVVDIDAALFKKLNHEQPDWQIKGELGIIRFCQKRAAR